MTLKQIQDGFVKKVSNNKLMKRIDSFDQVFEDKTRLSIDIGASSLKAVQVKIAPNSVHIIKADCQEIKYDDTKASSSGEGDENAIAEALNRVLAAFKTKTRDVRVVLSDAAIYSRHIMVPRIAPEELAKSIKWQVEKYTPFAIDDAIVDFQNLASNSNMDESQIELVVVAVERKVVNKYLSVLKKLRLIPNIIDFSPFAAAKAMIRNYTFGEDELIPLVDIGARRTSITIIDGNELQLVRLVDTGGYKITQALAGGLGITRAEAEKLKRGIDIGGVSMQKERDLIVPVLDELVDDLRKSFAYVDREFLSKKVKRIFVCGGASQLTGLKEYFSSALGLPVQAVDAFEGMNLSGRIDEEQRQRLAPVILSAVGEVI